MDILGGLLTVERSIPSSVLAGLATQEYSLHGGVIRNSAGQIVRHLVNAPGSPIPLDPLGLLSAPFDIFNTYQLHNLKQLSEQILAVSTATMAMSGLTLAVSTASFAVLHSSLKKVDRRLQQVGRDVEWIKRFLDSERHAALMDAAQDLAALPSDPVNRNQILHNHRTKVGQIAMQYLHEWENTQDASLLNSISHQHFYCAAFLLKARCSAELGMFDNALTELTQGKEQWLSNSREIANSKILRGDAVRFLGNEYAENIPTAKLIEWMDFATDSSIGLEHMDELRKQSLSTNRFSWPFRSNQEKFEQQHFVEMMDSLVKRKNVLEGYETQYKFYADNEIIPSELEGELSQLNELAGENNLLVLAPKQDME
ncbi:hypothetical protein [Parahaliea mediterranea]|uniref:Uncharacterized protein n=1 Tax=Parahaliea mediterranea TaxID=651086 RepID=A0A939IKZ8_9GAMM|nr:hypothetical protein [Parahaliea mediterranea]MBN7797866.1 hypothetical protein [Parahaliea mediterranea]